MYPVDRYIQEYSSEYCLMLEFVWALSNLVSPMVCCEPHHTHPRGAGRDADISHEIEDLHSTCT